jgi:hypothetical protein
VVAGLSVLLTTRRLGRIFTPGLGLKTLVLLLTTPVWLTQWGTALIDGLLFSLGACGLLLSNDKSRESKKLIIVGIIFLAFVAGSKQNAVFLPVSVAIAWIGISSSVKKTVLLRRSLILGFCCIVFAGPWFWKNYKLYGNPIFPVGVSMNRSVLEKQRKSKTKETNSPLVKTSIVNAIKVLPRIATGYAWTGSCSPLLFCFLPVTLLFLRRSRCVVAAWVGTICIALFLMVFLSRLLYCYSIPRYFFVNGQWTYFLAAYGWNKWTEGSACRSRIALVLLVVTFVPTLALTATRSASRVSLLSGHQSINDFYRERNYGVSVYNKINEDFGPKDRLFAIVGRVNLIKVPRGQVVRSYAALWAGVSSEEQLRTALTKWNITHLIYSTGPGEHWDGIERSWILGPNSAIKNWICVKKEGSTFLYRRPYKTP